MTAHEPSTLTGHVDPRTSVRDTRIHVERRGIAHIPLTERHGRPRDIGLMWSSVGLNVQCVIYGALLITIGLSPLQSLIAVLIGNLSWVFTGLCSLAGPAAGTTTFAVNRAPFGRNGNRLIALFNWIMQLGYEVLQLVLMVLAAIALLDLLGIRVSTPGKVALVVMLAVAQSLLPLVGHAAITRILRFLVPPFAVIFILLAWLTAERLSVQAGQSAGWPLMLGGIALVASGGGLGWTPNAADFSRYLPITSSRTRLVTAVALGGAIPEIALMLLGVGVATVTSNATDPVDGLIATFPGWFVVPYLVLLMLQMGVGNAVDLYSSGVTLQAMGLRLARWQAVVLDGVVCTAVTIAVVISDSFYTYLSNFLLFMIVWFAPWAAIFIVDFFLRRGRYDIATLTGESVGRGVRRSSINTPGVVAQVLGMAASALCINTSVFVGPIAEVTGGTDLSIPAGMIVAAVVYWLLGRRTARSTATDTGGPPPAPQPESATERTTAQAS